MDKKFKFSFIAVLMLLNIFLWQEVFELRGRENLEVSFLDVGQGDSAFIETPQGHQILIDGGPGGAVLQKLNKLMPFFDRSIDVVILTHPEKDHMAGILEALQRYKIDYFFWTGVLKQNAENKRLAELLDEIKSPQKNFIAALSPKGLKVVSVRAGNKIKAGGAEIDILYPNRSLENKEYKDGVNDTSVVARIVFGKNSFLFTGDISSKAEKELVSGKSRALPANVLKVAHHGSKYSTSELFLESTAPKYAVISVGKNSYGHPTPEVLQRLQKYDIKTLRTDQSGDIEFVSDGNIIKLINN